MSSCLITPKDYPLGSVAADGGAGHGGAGGSAGVELGGAVVEPAGDAGEAGIAGTAGTDGGMGGSNDVAGGSNAGEAGSLAGMPDLVPSCVGLQYNCGLAAGDYCCASLKVKGGDFTLGGVAGTTPATIATFALDKYEVTLGRFRKFEAAHAWPPASGAGAHPLIAGSGWQAAWNGSINVDLASSVQCDVKLQVWDESGTNDRLPMNCVSWFEAFAFCAWDGGWLPTEAEWEYAAAGGVSELTYPWGNAPVPDNKLDSTAEYANYNGLGDGSAAGTLAFSDILPPGSKPLGVGRFGQMDLAGSMWEWALDYQAAYPSSCVNCANLTPAANRVLRGGGWNFAASYMTAAYRNGYNDRGSDIGFRCARLP